MEKTGDLPSYKDGQPLSNWFKLGYSPSVGGIGLEHRSNLENLNARIFSN